MATEIETSIDSITLMVSETQSDTQPDTLREIVRRFPANDFVPTGWFGTNPHWQTIVGTGALGGKLFGMKDRPFKTVEEEITTHDGDFFDVEFTENFSGAESVVIILHGLESTSKGQLVTNFATALMAKGFGCCLPNFRGCSGKLHSNPGGYHVGFTADVDRMVDVLNERYPTKDIYLCGFSLGGNVVLKFLGEQGERAKARRVRGAAVTCVPFDPVTCHRKLDVGVNRAIYSENFLLTLKVKAEKQNDQFPGLFDIDLVRKARTIGEIDDYFIAKIFGFADKFDYYAQCGSKRFLPAIRVPAIAINAIDDPFIEASSLPTDADVQEGTVKLIYHEHGGHCGFWAKSMSSSKAGQPAVPVPAHGWIAEELARALDFIRVETKHSW